MSLGPAVRTVTVLAVLAWGASKTGAQVPEKFKNLQVLAKNSSKAQLMRTMDGFADALGVECAHCHTGGNPDTFEGVDFASDDKWEKRTARTMLRMVVALNADYISRLEERSVPPGGNVPPKVRVECVTCHRGVTRPETITAIFTRALDSQGPEAALRQYGELRSKYLGRGSYDFSNGPLNTIGEDLLRAHHWQEALTVLEYTVASHPDEPWSLFWLGEARLAAGERAGALGAFEKALALQPDIERARKRLQELKSPVSPKP